MPTTAATTPSLGEHLVLAILAEQPAHGWAVARLLARDGDIGRIWSLSRPLTYRAVDQLAARGLIAQAATAQDLGPTKVIWKVTRTGRRTVATWLSRPVAHLRDVRTELLLKVVLIERAGRSPLDLLVAQRALLAPTVAALVDAGEQADAGVVERWRSEQAGAVDRFLDAEISRSRNGR